jgi:hypothetical protein
MGERQQITASKELKLYVVCEAPHASHQTHGGIWPVNWPVIIGYEIIYPATNSGSTTAMQ